MSRKRLKIFFSGIGGSGMSSQACFMADKGHIICGSDRAFDRNPGHPVNKLLKFKGVTIVPQDGKSLDESFDFAVFSTAVESDQPEIVKVKEIGLLTKTRPEFLAEIASDFRTIAIAGTSGKSTTAGMLSFLMGRLGLNPNFIGGGRVKQFRTETNPGSSIVGPSDILVIEACESDGTIVNYKPLHSVILNLALDHHSVDKTAAMFRSLIENTSGKVIMNADDNNLSNVRIQNAITFSIDKPSHYKAIDIVYGPFWTEFGLKITLPSIPSPQGRGAKGNPSFSDKKFSLIPSPLEGEGEGEGLRFGLSIPGKYNLYNALSCIAILSDVGVSLDEISGVLHEFEGIERRFDILFNDGKRLVIDDYAHNPHKISSLMDATRNIRERICYIFQPHGYAPTRMMKNEYIDSFAENLRKADHLILLPIFYAGGTVSRDISSHDLADGIRRRGKSVEAVEGRKVVLDRLNEWDSYVVFGARDETLSDFAREMARLLRTRGNLS